jgi:hypothetical protein
MNPTEEVHFILCPNCGSSLDAKMQCPGCRWSIHSPSEKEKLEDFFDLPNYPSEYYMWKRLYQKWRMWTV